MRMWDIKFHQILDFFFVREKSLLEDSHQQGKKMIMIVNKNSDMEVKDWEDGDLGRGSVDCF